MYASRHVKSLIKFVSAGFTIFILLSDTAFEWFMSFPSTVTWTGALTFTAGLCALVFAARRWPAKLRPYRGGIKKVLAQLKDSLFDFILAVLIVRSFYPLDRFLLPYYQNPWVLLTFVLEVVFVFDLWSLKNDNGSSGPGQSD